MLANLVMLAVNFTLRRDQPRVYEMEVGGCRFCPVLYWLLSLYYVRLNIR